MESIIESEIRLAITNFEPRAQVSEINVTADPQGNGYNVYLSFFINNLPQPFSITVFLERIR